MCHLHLDSAEKNEVFMTQAVSSERVLDTTAERYDAEKYKSSFSLDPQYVHDPKQGLQEKRITYLRDEGAFSLHSVDGAVIVRTLSEIYQKNKSAIWENIQQGYERTSRVIGLGGGGMSVGACLLGYANPVTAPIWFTTAGVIAGLSLIGYAYCSTSATKAHKQAQLWSHPSTMPQEVAEKRKIAYEKGFGYIYTNNLKNNLLHAPEVKMHYEQYLADFCKRWKGSDAHDDQGRYNWIVRFGEMNPLSLTLMKYGLGEIPHDLQTLSDRFEAFKAQVASKQSEFEKQKQLIRGESSQHIQSIEAEKSHKVGHCNQTLQGQLAIAKAKRDEVFDARHLERCPDCRAAEERLQFEKGRHESAYSAQATPLNAFFDREVQEVRFLQTQKLQGLSDEEARDIQLKTDARLQVYAEEKASKLKSCQQELQSEIATAKQKADAINQAEYETNVRQIRNWEKERLKGLCYEAIEEIEKETDLAIAQLENTRQVELTSAQNNYHTALATAKAKRDEICKDFPDQSSQEYMQAGHTFQHQQKRQQEHLSTATSQINIEYNGKIQTEKDAEKKILKGLTREEVAQVKQEANQLVIGLHQGLAKIQGETDMRVKKECEALYAQKVALIQAEFENKTEKAFASEIKSQRGLTREEIVHIKQKAQSQIQTLEEKRVSELNPYYHAFQQKNVQSQAIRDAAFTAHRQQAEQIYTQEKQHYERVHSQNVAQITSAYNSHINAIKGTKDEAINRVFQQEVHEIAKFYGPGKELLNPL
jgi:hypothetical protein